MEHLTATDRGVTMFRGRSGAQIGRRRGDDPAGLCRTQLRSHPDLLNDTIVRVPPADARQRQAADAQPGE